MAPCNGVIGVSSMSVFDLFRRDRRGNVAVIFGLAAIPIVAATGIAVDYGRASMAHARLADVLDAAVLAVGAKPSMTDAAATTVVTDWVNAQLGESGTISSWTLDSLAQSNGKITVHASAQVPTTLTKLIGVDSMPVRVLSEAIRSVNKLEVALVLDTTESMNQPATKMSSLKTAAKNLVARITADPKADVKIAIVPYGQYVNVGVANRNQPWISVPADYNTTTPGSCPDPITKETICDQYSTSTYSCQSLKDGVLVNGTCTTKTCIASHDVIYDPPKQPKCSDPKTTPHTFSGCVGSPAYPKNVSDDDATRVYPGYLDLTCGSPFTPLTATVKTVTTAIDALKAANDTYIPSGLAWGFNVLSSVTPITDAAPYDPTGRNLNPTKALVLMTDGLNTKLRNTTTNTASTSFGRHDGNPAKNPDGTLKTATQTNTWTLELCTNIKAKNIEIYTVAFMVPDETAKTMLQACASSSDNYFDAADATALLAAFGQIAEDMNNLRLTR